LKRKRNLPPRQKENIYANIYFKKYLILLPDKNISQHPPLTPWESHKKYTLLLL
jgi:hypothetical protein